MFRKSDGDLFARIFDEGQSGDTRIEWMRDGLKELREVPPHGLSNERLRDRLLGTAMTPAKSASAPWWAWAWAPVAAAAIAVVILPRLRPSVEPSVVLNSGAIDRVASNSPRIPGGRIASPDSIRLPATTADDALDIESMLASAASTMSVSEPEVVKSDGSLTRRSARSTNRRRVPSSPRLEVAVAPRSMREEFVTKSAPVTVALTSQNSEAGAPAADSTVVALRAPAADPLVLLDPEINALTGAAAAVEVSSPENLSVGG